MQTIKKWLNQQGRTLDGRPIFRLVWSSHEQEYRFGEFNKFYGEIYLGCERGLRLVPKYPYIGERWILEKYAPPEQAYVEDIPETRHGSYEPFFVFEDSKGNPLPVTLKVVEFLVNFSRKAIRASPITRAIELRDEAQVKEDKEVQEFMDSLECSEICNALHMREGVGYSKEIKNV